MWNNKPNPFARGGGMAPLGPDHTTPEITSSDIAQTTHVTIMGGLRVTFLGQPAKFVTILPPHGSSGVALTAAEFVDLIRVAKEHTDLGEILK